MTARTYGPSTIFRYELTSIQAGSTEGQVIELPRHADVLHVAPSDREGLLAIWVLIPCDHNGQPKFVPTERRFRIFGTGHPIPGHYLHHGSVQDGDLVWHLWEKISP